MFPQAMGFALRFRTPPSVRPHNAGGHITWRLSFWAPLYQTGYPATLSSAVHFSTGRFQMIAITVFTGPIF
jgi:hypothetical protein